MGNKKREFKYCAFSKGQCKPDEKLKICMDISPGIN